MQGKIRDQIGFQLFKEGIHILLFRRQICHKKRDEGLWIC